MAAEAVVENPVTTARGRINNYIGHINFMRDRVEKIADVMFGSLPNPPAGPEARPVREGEAGRLHDDLDLLDASLCKLQRELDRLDSLAFDAPMEKVAGSIGTGVAAAAGRR